MDAVSQQTFPIWHLCSFGLLCRLIRSAEGLRTHFHTCFVVVKLATGSASIVRKYPYHVSRKHFTGPKLSYGFYLLAHFSRRISSCVAIFVFTNHIHECLTCTQTVHWFRGLNEIMLDKFTLPRLDVTRFLWKLRNFAIGSATQLLQ